MCLLRLFRLVHLGHRGDLVSLEYRVKPLPFGEGAKHVAALAPIAARKAAAYAVPLCAGLGAAANAARRFLVALGHGVVI